MFGLQFKKFDSMTYVVLYKNGNITKEGRGLSFFYFSPNSSIAAIPMGSNDIPFIFNETTLDFQTIAIQGQITYKINDPKQIASLLDLTIDDNGKYKTADIDKLNQRVVNEAQTATAAYLQSLNLKEALRSAKAIEQQITSGLYESKAIALLGIEPLSVTVLAIKPTPEMARALEAEKREALQQEADQAIYERRNNAVAQERMIKESELNTEIAIEEKKKQKAEKVMQGEVQAEENRRRLREMKIAADIAVEEQRQTLIDLLTDNDRKEADTQSYKLDTMLKPYSQLDWKTIMAINPAGNDAKLNIALAFRELAENATKIGALNITPDLLNTLAGQKD